jgi:hypothetical protein
VQLLLLTADPDPGSVLPALALLPHGVRTIAPEVAALLDAGSYDAVLVDARTNLVAARCLCRLLVSTGTDVAVVAVLSEGGLVAVSGECDPAPASVYASPGSGSAPCGAGWRPRNHRRRGARAQHLIEVEAPCHRRQGTGTCRARSR